MFQTAVDIANRALQHCGVPRIDATLGFTENSQRAGETSFVYDKLRRAELRRNTWRFATRRTAIRAIDGNTLLIAPSLWSASATYFQGSIVADETGYLWQSKIQGNLGNDPQNSYTWEPYFGPMTASLYDSSQGYYTGEIVYTAAGDGTYNTYASLTGNNVLDPSLPNQWSASTTYFLNQIVQAFPAWSSGTTYTKGQTVTYTDGFTYSSLVNSNTNNIPPATSSSWALVPTLTLQTQAVPATSANSISPPSSSPVIEWSSTTAYGLGNFVMFNGTEYVSVSASNTGNLPTNATYWAALTLGTFYMSLINLNTGNNPASAPALYDNAHTYALNDLVGASDGVIYKSLSGSNTGHDPVSDGGVHWQNTGVLNPWTTVFTQGGGNQQWLQVGGASFPYGIALTTIDLVYPLGSGPAWQTSTRNVYRLPAGYLRRACQDPKAGIGSWLGAPSGRLYEDWVFEGNYIVTWQSNPIVFRFVADVVDVTTFDDMFCEGLACRVADAVVEILTQSTEKLRGIQVEYQKFMGEARIVNGIETDPIEDAEDDYIACRI
jgi:hypothetical protein